jgi:hypothetical protein
LRKKDGMCGQVLSYVRERPMRWSGPPCKAEPGRLHPPGRAPAGSRAERWINPLLLTGPDIPRNTPSWRARETSPRRHRRALVAVPSGCRSGELDTLRSRSAAGWWPPPAFGVRGGGRSVAASAANHVRVRSAAPCRTRAPVVTWPMSVRDRFGLRVGLGAALEGRARRSEAIHGLGMARVAATKDRPTRHSSDRGASLGRGGR